jgi:peptidoglycan/LPS O-acetylase OafA/YrhL
MGDSTEVRTTSRYTSLDGLRGLAALVVLIHHCFLVSPQLSAAVDSNGTGHFDSWVWWTTFTPLHLVWAGQEAVFVFFILSGFVLTLPFVRSMQTSWAAYYPRRILRIYLPVWASLIFALLMAWMVPRLASVGLSPWVNVHDEAPNVLSDAFLLRGAGSLNSPLWSLQWEMIFSLTLPLYVVAAMSLRRLWLVGVSGLVILVGAGEMMHLSSLVCLPIFGVGALMATRRDLLEEWARKVAGWGWMGLLAASILLLCSRWIFPQSPVVMASATFGGALLLFAFLGCKTAITLGNSSFIHWLGLRSFSLYLVHEPIVVSVAFFLHTTNAFQVAVFAVPLSLLAAEVFFRLVERTSHRLSGWVGRTITDRVSRHPEEVSIASP